MEADFAFVNRIRDREVKQLFLIGGHRMLNEALSPALQQPNHQ
jgi:hypothetical protein